MHIKKEVRIIAWDDCAFSFKQKRVGLVGVVFRGGDFIDGLLSTKIEKDGTDATGKIISAIIGTRHYDQLSVIMTDGVTFGGLNVADIKKISKATKLPVIAVQRKKPDMKEFTAAIKRMKNPGPRVSAVKNAGKFYKYREIHFQKCGINEQDAVSLLKLTCIRSKIPEPIRVAHIIASGLSRRNTKDADLRSKSVYYESRGRA